MVFDVYGVPGDPWGPGGSRERLLPGGEPQGSLGVGPWGLEPLAPGGRALGTWGNWAPPGAGVCVRVLLNFISGRF